MVTLGDLPQHAPTGFGLPEELTTIALVGRLSLDVGRYHDEASEDRRLAAVERKEAREWFARYDKRQDHQLGLIQGDIQRINARLEEGDAEFKSHRAELLAKDDKIAALVDCVTALNLEVQRMRLGPAYATSRRALAGIVILLLEDSDLVRAATTKVLEDYGAHVLQACTVDEAKALLDAHASPPPHVVAVDLKLETVSAMPVVRMLRASYSVGIVIVTGDISEFERAEAAELNIRVIGKPFSVDSLIEAIKAAAIEP
jgi:CheY-like chemotaxis protein